MKKYTKSEIMKAAWKIARIGQKKFGGSARQYLSETLKMVWTQVKNKVIVPAWALVQKVSYIWDADCTMCTVIKESEKAYYVRTKLNECAWVSKSIVEKGYAF